MCSLIFISESKEVWMGYLEKSGYFEISYLIVCITHNSTPRKLHIDNMRLITHYIEIAWEKWYSTASKCAYMWGLCSVGWCKVSLQGLVKMKLCELSCMPLLSKPGNKEKLAILVILTYW